MSSPDSESVQKALNSLAGEIDQLMVIQGHDQPLDETGRPRAYIMKAIATWLRKRYPKEEISTSTVWKVFEHLLPVFQVDNEELDRRRNIANVGYYQRGRDYQWEREDLEPGHWEDHMSPPDWMVED